MLSKDTINIHNAKVTCTCGHQEERNFNSVKNFNFNQGKIGVNCSKCGEFIPITEFLNKKDLKEVTTTFMNNVCNL